METVGARRRAAARSAQLTAVGVRIGELSNVDRDALAFAFEALTRKTPLGALAAGNRVVPTAAEVPGVRRRIRGARI